MFTTSRSRAIFNNTEEQFTELATIWLAHSRDRRMVELMSVVEPNNKNYNFYADKHKELCTMHTKIQNALASKREGATIVAVVVGLWQEYIYYSSAKEDDFKYGYDLNPDISKYNHELAASVESELKLAVRLMEHMLARL